MGQIWHPLELVQCRPRSTFGYDILRALISWVCWIGHAICVWEPFHFPLHPYTDIFLASSAQSFPSCHHWSEWHLLRGLRDIWIEGGLLCVLKCLVSRACGLLLRFLPFCGQLILQAGIYTTRHQTFRPGGFGGIKEYSTETSSLSNMT